MLSPEPSLPPELAPAWEAVLAEWSSEARHAAFIELCALADRLPDAAASYRHIKEGDPARAAEADRQLQRIVARALASLAQQAPEPATTPAARRLVLVLALLVTTALMGSAVYAATRILAFDAS